MGTELVGIREAAARCAVSDETIRRRLKDGRFPNAAREHEPNGQWLIPVADLIDAGLRPYANPSSRPEVTDELAARIRDLEIRCARAEALADARAAHIDDLRRHIRSIETHEEH